MGTVTKRPDGRGEWGPGPSGRSGRHSFAHLLEGASGVQNLITSGLRLKTDRNSSDTSSSLPGNWRVTQGPGRRRPRGFVDLSTGTDCPSASGHAPPLGLRTPRPTPRCPTGRGCPQTTSPASLPYSPKTINRVPSQAHPRRKGVTSHTPFTLHNSLMCHHDVSSPNSDFPGSQSRGGATKCSPEVSVRTSPYQPGRVPTICATCIVYPI